MQYRTYLSLVCFLLILSGCANAKPAPEKTIQQEPTIQFIGGSGEATNGRRVFESADFGVSLNYPEGWGLQIIGFPGLDTHFGDIFLWYDPHTGIVCSLQFILSPSEHIKDTLQAGFLGDTTTPITPVSINGMLGYSYVFPVNDRMQTSTVYEIISPKTGISIVPREGVYNDVCIAGYKDIVFKITPL